MEVSVFSVQVSGQMKVSVFSFQRFRFYSLTPETRHLTPQKPGFGACILGFNIQIPEPFTSDRPWWN
jgi:hypothetical protein